MSYTIERNVQILIYLLKANGIRKVVACPGTTNLTFVASLQQAVRHGLSFRYADELVRTGR